MYKFAVVYLKPKSGCISRFKPSGSSRYVLRTGGSRYHLPDCITILPYLNKPIALMSLLCFSPSLISAQQLPQQISLDAGIINTSKVAYGAYEAFESLQLRAGTDGDSDGDSIPDSIDVDDDNDTIPDDVEGTADADLDGVADCLDLDSDNDGITDLFEAVSGSGLMLLVDANRDGKLDASVSVGENGLADVVERSTESATSQIGAADLDGDGIPDHLDLDVDNDGIPDVIEAGNRDEQFDGRYDSFVDLDNDGLADVLSASPIVPIDSDQDGIEDFRDLDSDGDGLTDRMETFGADTDSDGQVDNPVDANTDGLDDGYQSRATAMPDTDNDGFPDFRDVDSDADGVFDSEEAFGVTNPGETADLSSSSTSTTGAQGEGVTLRTGESGSVFGCSLGYDKKFRQPFDPIFLLMLGVSTIIVFGRRHWRWISTGRHLALVAIASTLLFATGCTSVQSGNRTAARSLQPYSGIGFGASFLNADTSNLAFDQDKSNSVAGQVTLGLSLGYDRALEVRAADLGQATFTSGDAVGYQVADISALYKRHWGEYSGFARLGIGALFNDGDIPTAQKNKTHLMVGFGAEYNLSSRVALRAGWQGHDVDVMHGQLSVLYRFGASTSGAAPLVVARNNSVDNDSRKLSDTDFTAVPDKSSEQEPVAIGEQALSAAQPETDESGTVEPEAIEPEPAIKPEETVTASTPEPSATVPEVEVKAADNAEVPVEEASSGEQLALVTSQDNPLVPEATKPTESTLARSENVAAPANPDTDGAVGAVGAIGADDALDSCPDAPAELSALGEGCSLFEDLLPSLTFVPDTDQLTESGENVLNTVADGLAEESDIQVTVAVHTAPATDANEAMFLTRRRTIAIIRYLSDKGIDATRLRPEAYGDTRPLADAKNPNDNEGIRHV